MDRQVERALAGVRVLVCVARADGKLTDGERAALEGALAGLPGVPALEELLGSYINLEEQLEALGDDEARAQVHDAAWVMAHADGEASASELAILERIKPFREESLVEQVIGETKDTFLPSNIDVVHDPEQRAVEIQEDTMKYAVLAAVLGAMPIPGVGIVTDLMVVGLQVKLVRDIGLYWGHKVDEKAARSMLASVLGSVGVRVAINNVARFVPGWGSLMAAVTSFASTVAVGKMAAAYFESGGEMGAEALRATYEQGLKEGKKAYEENAARVAEAKATHADRVGTLNDELKLGRISREEFERQVAELR